MAVALLTTIWLTAPSPYFVVAAVIIIHVVNRLRRRLYRREEARRAELREMWQEDFDASLRKLDMTRETYPPPDGEVIDLRPVGKHHWA